ncbi:proton-conducting transporter membrane subunit [Tissierella sp. Yu-01]|uniref:complex I subunit 5 family protein n=1 Tax=Tissierella sp. Yu-01 TaxID=3035694 RepID=UPI00240DAB96|nr:proton-conducting transporter membrane subunit [Tissierella sp. Yu-01]WFA08475.1 proton-conducting transporter membrane subunit [Tissierella sp. Yu-01]
MMISLIILGILFLISGVLFVNSISIESLMTLFFTGIGFIISWSSTSMIEYDIKKERISLYNFMVVFLILSLCGIVSFNHLLIVFVFIELSAFLAAGIVMIKESKENLKAGLKYLLLSIFASAFLLIGIVILYRLTGTFNIIDMEYKIYAMSNISLIKYSFIFIFIGIALKSALFPFHIWLPDAHGSAPAISSAILSALVLKGYIVFFIKLIYLVFGIEMVGNLNILNLILILGVCAMIYGSVFAIMQRKLKKMIAYSSVAQIGYIFMGIGLGTPLGLIASIFHIIAHGVTKACLFLCAGQIIEKTGYKDIDDLSGVGKAMPITMGLFTICGLSMIGIPLLIGFSSKWNFAQAIMDSGSYWIILILSLSSLLNAAYYLPISIRAYFNKSGNGKFAVNLETRRYDFLPLIILGISVILLGIFSSPVINVIKHIVRVII